MTQGMSPGHNLAVYLSAIGVAAGLCLSVGTSSSWAQSDRGNGPHGQVGEQVGESKSKLAGESKSKLAGESKSDGAKPLSTADSGPASAARSASDSGDGKPWVEGVPADQQNIAIDLYERGNSALDDALWLAAVGHYRRALEYWDHPGIHYNLAIALINLDQPIPAYKSILKALRHNGAALESEQVQQAQMYRMVLRGQVAEIEVSCPLEGAVVTLNGKPLFTSPGRERRMVRPGAHQLIARKPGYVDGVETVVATPDGTVPIEVRPRKPVELPRQRRWARWKPWVVVGAGALVGLAGTAAHSAAADRYSRADELLARSCPTGCYGGEYPPAFDALEQDAFSYGALAWTSYAVGGAVIAVGAALMVINRPRPIKLEAVTENDPAATGRDERISSRVTIAPMLTPNTRGLAARFAF